MQNSHPPRFFLIDDNLINFPICTSEISHGFKSDHSYISLNLQGSDIKHGRGYWKLNNSLLSNESFIREAKDIISSTSSESFDSYRGLWDVIKFKIKDCAIRLGSKLKRKRNQEKESLLKEIERIKNCHNFVESDELRKKMFDAQCSLDKIIADEVTGKMIRSRAKWTEEGERSTKYFFGLEKSNGKKKALTKIVDESGNPVFDQESISINVVSFYQQLYNTRNPSNRDLDEYINSCNLDQVPPDLQSGLENGLRMEEMDVVIGKLKNNKSPGWDGLTAEFYKKFWLDIRELLFKALSESVDTGTMSPSQRTGILTLIPKPKAPTELIHLQNWRPITLLNVDYKIFTHIIKNRLVRTLPSIIGNAQSGFQKGRSTCDNLLLMSLALEFYHENEEEEGLLLQCDFAKAFDSVEHQFLFKTLRAFGFGEYIINLIKVAFTGCMSYANVNGHLSNPIYLLRGLHQGSPLSPILFLIVAQVFTVRLESNNNIEGVNISGATVLLSLFADDTDIFLKPTINCISAVVEELELFGSTSGCKPNLSKTHCIPLGAARHNSVLLDNLTTRYGPTFLVNTFSALGITFSNHQSLAEIGNSNYNAKIAKARAWTDMWSKRDLTIYGKVTILKSLVLSQFTYLVIPLPRPNAAIMKEINTLTYHFLWGCKRDKVKREIVARPIDEGGLNLFSPQDFFNSLKCSILVKVLSDQFSHPWKCIFYNQLRFPEYPLISIENGLVKSRCILTSDLLNCYWSWKEAAAKRYGGSVNHCVWNNRLITDVGAKLMNENLISKSIMYLSDFLSEEKSVLDYSSFLVRWNLTSSDITPIQYVNIKMAIRRYDCPSINSKSIELLEATINITFISSRNILPSKLFREAIRPPGNAEDLAPLKDWKRILGRYRIDWAAILSNNYRNISNNFKLVQFQYKLLMKLSTSKLMRHKMGIEPTNGLCRHCTQLESLQHIFMNCVHSTRFIKLLNRYITVHFDTTYSDNLRYYFLTCDHSNTSINFLNLVAKWYISREFQNSRDLRWDSYCKFVKIFMTGEREIVRNMVEPIFNST